MTSNGTGELLPQPDEASVARLITSLDNPLAFGHPVQYIRHIETHISWIILTGNYAYKIRKPVNFGFLDFSTLEKRRFYCEEELRLNRRFAPDIYLEVAEIRGSETAPRLHGDGEVFEYAVRMVEFPQHCLLSSHATRQDLNTELIDAIANKVGKMHAGSEPVDAASVYGDASVVAQWSAENMSQIANAIPAELIPQSYSDLETWYRENETLLADIDQRKRDGFVRECHGDLHLGNMALLGDEVTLFDCIEFNPELRWIDTISEAAFVAMDLEARGYPGFCWQFINRYLESTNDYTAVRLLRYYVIYRALVRAKVEALRTAQEERVSNKPDGRFDAALAYINLAHKWASSQRPAMIIMHGLSGSGKSTIAGKLAQSLGVFQLRSDVVRKRLFDLGPEVQTDSAQDQGIYTAYATDSTYQRLQHIAAMILDAGFTVILDATFLEESQRRQMLATKTSTEFKKIIIDCDVPVDELRRRILARANDPSEANLEVLEQQLDSCQPLTAAEAEQARIFVAGEDGFDIEEMQRLEELLAS
jgi:aminoglycoside phosphotransferase family enzyme/predicted kinase